MGTSWTAALVSVISSNQQLHAKATQQHTGSFYGRARRECCEMFPRKTKMAVDKTTMIMKTSNELSGRL